MGNGRRTNIVVGHFPFFFDVFYLCLSIISVNVSSVQETMMISCRIYCHNVTAQPNLLITNRLHGEIDMNDTFTTVAYL